MTDDANQSLVSATKNLVAATNLISTTLQKVLPVVQSTATAATAGANGAVPAQVAGYLNITLPNGAAAKVPYFNV